MSAPHTPGKWRAALLTMSHGIYGDDGTRIGGAKRGADARLIAAAPDMLAALQDMAVWFAAHTEDPASKQHVAAARAAIAKATGGDH